MRGTSTSAEANAKLLVSVARDIVQDAVVANGAGAMSKSAALTANAEHDLLVGDPERALSELEQAWHDVGPLARLLRSGQLHPDAKPAAGPGGEGERPVVCLGDRLDDCQAEADTCLVGADAFGAAKERLGERGNRPPA